MIYNRDKRNKKENMIMNCIDDVLQEQVSNYYELILGNYIWEIQEELEISSKNRVTVLAYDNGGGFDCIIKPDCMDEENFLEEYFMDDELSLLHFHPEDLLLTILDHEKYIIKAEVKILNWIENNKERLQKR